MDYIEKMKKEIEQGIKDVLEGKDTIYDHTLGNLDLFITISENLGAKHCDEFDSNGWEADMWDYVSYKDKKFQVTSSGYYGGADIRSEYY